MRIYVKVIPRASKNEVLKISEEEYKIRVTAPPIDNKANIMLLSIVADYFDIPKSSLKIVGGKTARVKIIEIL